MLCRVDSNSVNLLFFFNVSSGLSSPPANITTSAVPSIVTPIVNGFTGIPHQPNGHPAVETVYTNGLPPYSTQSPTAADTLQQAFTGVQQYTGVATGGLCLPVCCRFVASIRGDLSSPVRWMLLRLSWEGSSS